jgi:hypothetical protein
MSRLRKSYYLGKFPGEILQRPLSEKSIFNEGSSRRGILMNLNRTVIVSSGTDASIIGILQFFTMCYVARLAGHVERKLKIAGNGDNERK